MENLPFNLAANTNNELHNHLTHFLGKRFADQHAPLENPSEVSAKEPESVATETPEVI